MSEITETSSKTSAASGARSRELVCVFTLGSERHALATSVLQEVVRELTVESVPLTPASVLGVFNLRGTPTVLVDARALLGKPAAEDATRVTALVLRDEELRVALAVDRVEGIVEMTESSQFQTPSANAEYSEGFMELPNKQGLVALLSAARLLEGIRALQFTKRTESATQALEH
jgi:purine-binding chemotaxis protein CheW